MLFYIITALTYLIVGPISTLIHELFHALPVLILTKNQAIIILGSDKGSQKEISFGRLTIILRSYAMFTGLIYHKGHLTKQEEILSIISGPVITLIMLIVALYIRLTLVDPNIILDAVTNSCVLIFAGQFLMTSIPMTYQFGNYEGLPSDGKRLLETLKNKEI